MELLKLNSNTFIEIISTAKKQIIISMPNISDVMAISLAEYKKKGIDIHVFLEFSENIYRSGYGEFESINTLKNAGIEILNKSNFNIYFIIIDDWGYLYFPKSSFMEEEGIAYDLLPMETLQLKSLKLMFNLLDDEDRDFETLAEDVGIEKLEEISKNINYISDNEISVLENKFKTDVPLKPDYGRTLETYKAKFQLVELKFTGANFLSKKVKLPPKALPFKDMQLQKAIEANLRLFTDYTESEYLNDFNKLKEKIEIIREKYCYHLKCREKNIIIRDEKGNFISDIDSSKGDILKTQVNLLNMLQSEINKSREQIRSNLFIFLLSNPPDNYKSLNETNLKNEIRNMVNGIVSKIHFPLAAKLINDMKLEYSFYDLTWEDLNNEKVLTELLEKGLINNNEKSYFDELAIAAKKENICSKTINQ